MKLFFAGSIRGGGGYVKVYRRIIALLTTHGEVISDFTDDNGIPEKEGKKSDIAIHSRTSETIRHSDLVVAEVSHPSIGVGYEIALAESLGVPVIALYHRGSEHRLSAMIAGNEKIITLPYDTFEELGTLLGKQLAPLSL
jgi:2'-deoxynucleoside 5'-phosphate N-hydrolase